MKRKDYLRRIGKIKDNKIKHTYSTNFLLPMLNFNLNEDFLGTLINVHLINEKQPKLVVILQNNPLVQEDIRVCEINYNYIKHEIFKEEVVIWFNLPEQHYDDYLCFINGSYSKFSEPYKSTLRNIYGLKSIVDKNIDKNNWDLIKLVTIYDIIHPRKIKRQLISDYLNVSIDDIQEVFDKPDMKYEEYVSLQELTEQEELLTETN